MAEVWTQLMLNFSCRTRTGEGGREGGRGGREEHHYIAIDSLAVVFRTHSTYCIIILLCSMHPWQPNDSMCVCICYVCGCYRENPTLMALPSLVSATASCSCMSDTNTFFNTFFNPLLILPSTAAVAAEGLNKHNYYK